MAAKEKKGIMKYFKNVRAELKKVSWPNKKELINYTTVVLIFSGIATLGIWIFDTVFRYGMNFL